ncbi:MAG: S-methyl-5-thioribose-1-phosphate isomerase [Parvibaculum sp.]|nr:S-methyl-5-thioribose-1-phosphate isomerase [Parvibaculum sp.]
MKIDGIHYRTIWVADDGWSVEIIDQTRLPHQFTIARLETADDAARAIKDMLVRGAPLIGATAAYGLCLALRKDASDETLARTYDMLLATRPTAVNLKWSLDAMRDALAPLAGAARIEAAYATAARLCDEDVEICRLIGENGLRIIRGLSEAKQGRAVNILTHCNAGWLACVDWGTALAPIYMAHDAGIAVHVWVDETRPRNQGASLTAFELGRHGVPHTIVPDNAGGHLMQHGLVDMCITGTDRTTATGDVANKIGTYLKALAADANGVPFYVALPHTTIDWSLSDGVREIEIEQRSPREVTHMTGRTEEGEIVTVEISAPGSPAANYGFDVTPARYVTGLITERGVAPASREGLLSLYPERRDGGRI